MNNGKSRLVVVSNRLPVAISRDENGWSIKQGSGGLVTALAPVLRNRGGLWIGWSGGAEDTDFLLGHLQTASRTTGFDLHPVALTAEEIRHYYHGFSNEIIWPLFHDLQTRCNFRPAYWYAYLDVNRKFAEFTASLAKDTDFIWVQDYHLMLLARILKEKGFTGRVGFFLHIPFPALDIFLKLPWRAEILRALLAYDIVGFQTERDKRNFLACLHALLPEILVTGKGQVVRARFDDREVRIGYFPISIDFRAFAEGAAAPESEEVLGFLHETIPDRAIILGIDRLDYTKGIPERLEAIRDALTRFPELVGKITLVQLVVPSRAEVPEYQALKAEIERLVGEINGQFTRYGWVPIHYMYRSLGRAELLAFYRRADMALVTPLKDGMNLVAKEYCACKIENDGVLILSEFAGAATQLHPWALMVNPYDIEGVSSAIHTAYHMDPEEKARRMKRLRASVRRRDIFWWVDRYLDAALSKRLPDFPPVVDYVPQLSQPV